jgi:hypothetical protein
MFLFYLLAFIVWYICEWCKHILLDMHILLHSYFCWKLFFYYMLLHLQRYFVFIYIFICVIMFSITSEEVCLCLIPSLFICSYVWCLRKRRRCHGPSNHSVVCESNLLWCNKLVLIYMCSHLCLLQYSSISTDWFGGSVPAVPYCTVPAVPYYSVLYLLFVMYCTKLYCTCCSVLFCTMLSPTSYIMNSAALSKRLDEHNFPSTCALLAADVESLYPSIDISRGLDAINDALKSSGKKNRHDSLLFYSPIGFFSITLPN